MDDSCNVASVSEVGAHLRRVVVVGADLMLGRHLVERYASIGSDEVFAFDLDHPEFLSLEETILLLERIAPSGVILLGVFEEYGDASFEPSDKIFRGLSRLINLFEAAANYGVESVVVALPASVYSDGLKGPRSEADIHHTGRSEVPSAAVHVCRTVLHVQASYMHQFGLKCSVLVYPEVYSEFELAGAGEPGLLAAAALSFAGARQGKAASPSVAWRASDRLQFTYAGDVAEIVQRVSLSPTGCVTNVGAAPALTGQQAADVLSEVFGGHVRAEFGEGDACALRELDVSRARGLGLVCSTSLRSGVERFVAQLLDR